MTIRHLKIFVTVAETGKMSTAAEKLFLSQPTVSQAIRELELHYGIPLFERFSKKLYITESGKKLLLYARQLLAQYDTLEKNMAQDSAISHLRIGATLTVGISLLPGLLEELRCSSPNLDIFSFVGNTRVIEQKLLDSSLDIAIVEGTIRHPDLVTLPVARDFLILACRKDHPLAQRTHIHASELGSYTFALREEGSGTRELFVNYMATLGIPLRVGMESYSPESLKQALLTNNYLTVISSRLWAQEIKKGQIHAIQNQDHDWERKFHLVYHKDKFRTPGMLLLKKALENLPEYSLPIECHGTYLTKD